MLPFYPWITIGPFSAILTPTLSLLYTDFHAISSVWFLFWSWPTARRVIYNHVTQFNPYTINFINIFNISIRDIIMDITTRRLNMSMNEKVIRSYLFFFFYGGLNPFPGSSAEVKLSCLFLFFNWNLSGGADERGITATLISDHSFRGAGDERGTKLAEIDEAETGFLSQSRAQVL